MKTKEDLDLAMDSVQEFSYSPKLTVRFSYNHERCNMPVAYLSNYNISPRIAAQQFVGVRVVSDAVGFVAFSDILNHFAKNIPLDLGKVKNSSILRSIP